jgi:hypothetical protein
MTLTLEESLYRHSTSIDLFSKPYRRQNGYAVTTVYRNLLEVRGRDLLFDTVNLLHFNVKYITKEVLWIY